MSMHVADGRINKRSGHQEAKEGEMQIGTCHSDGTSCALEDHLLDS